MERRRRMSPFRRAGFKVVDCSVTPLHSENLHVISAKSEISLQTCTRRLTAGVQKCSFRQIPILLGLDKLKFVD